MKIVFLGSGNVATHLALAFKQAGQQVSQVWSRNLSHALELAGKVNDHNQLSLAGKFRVAAINDLSVLDRSADLYLISIKDEAIRELVPELEGLKGVVAHTSGATAIDVLKRMQAYGVFYPLQTFSKHKALDLSTTPMCLEAGSAETMNVLQQAAKMISTAIYPVDSEHRKVLHLAAVFACNFSNHLYQMGYSILKQHDLDFALLKPLIIETALKVQEGLPYEVQTGPAIRNDEATMEKHLTLLNDRPELQDIYTILSDSIKKTHL